MEEEDSNEEVEEVNVAGANMPSVDLSTVLNSQTEDQLMQNPIPQKMMTKFFEDKFKDIQGQGLDGKNNGKRGEMVNEGIIKSPSDTTIYAPALNKKLTTADNILLNRNLPQAKENMAGISQRNENHDQINHEIECFVDAARKEAEISRGQNGIMEKSNPG